jgi:uncharacterized protein (TIGR02147 family)
MLKIAGLMEKTVQIFDYMDYREFLRNMFNERKSMHSIYSYRLFSLKAGFKSPNFLKLVIDGDRNLTKESIFRVAKAFSLNKKESEYFENLVFFNQSKTLEEKNVYLARVVKYRSKTDSRILEESEYDYYSKWYNPVVRELVTSVDFKDDYKKLGESVIPVITAQDAARSVELLERLKFIERQSDGQYKMNTLSLTTGLQVRSIAVANYHKEMMRIAAESIERIPKSDRDISSVTIRLSDENYKTAIDKIQMIRKEILELAEADDNLGRIAQFNLQIFPVSVNFPNGARKK